MPVVELGKPRAFGSGDHLAFPSLTGGIENDLVKTAQWAAWRTKHCWSFSRPMSGRSRWYAVLINPRKGQPLFQDHIRFLARGIYELHCVEDPNDPIPLIIDVSAAELGKSRILRTYEMPVEKAISLDEFDDALRQFLKALTLAGVALPTDTADVISLFRKP